MRFGALLLGLVIGLAPTAGLARRDWGIDENPAAAACTPNRAGDDRAAEIARIRACLESVARPPRDDERFLYSYVHAAKVAEIRSASKHDFCVYEYTRQNTVEAVKHARALEAVNALDVAKIAEARQLAPQLNDLLDVQERATGQGIAYSQTHALNLVALDKIYPGFLEGIETDPAEELRALGGSTTPADRGAATGLRIALADTTHWYAKASATTGGKGVYLSREPASKFGHFEGGALACGVTDRVRIVDIYDDATRRTLADAQIVVPDRSTGFLRPNSGHNLVVAPVEFEAAAVGFILRFSGAGGEMVYVDKCALDLRTMCRDIALEDFRECPSFEKFGRDSGEEIFALVEAQGNFSRKFFEIWNECAGDDAEDEHVCRGLAPNLPSHLRAYLKKNAKKDYERAMKSCGLKP